jgi:hypothetical protein
MPLGSKGDGFAPTQPLEAADFEGLPTLPRFPTIFQERIDARLDIRVTAIGDRIIAAEIESQAAGSSRLD